MIEKRFRKLAAAVFMLAAAVLASRAFSTGTASARQSGLVLDNGLIRAEFDDSGLVKLSALQSGLSLDFSGDRASVIVNDRKLDVSSLGPAEVEITPSRLVYSYVKDPFTVDISYELRPNWHFLAKQVIVTSASSAPFKLGEVMLWETTLGRPVAGELPLGSGRFGVIWRFSGGDDAAAAGPAWSLFALLQNPFMSGGRSGDRVTVSYTPDMEWRPDYGPFSSDRLCLGPVSLEGLKFPALAVPEWKLVADYEKLLAETQVIFQSEVEAVSECVRAFLLHVPQKSLRVHIPWCENDYQIDVGTPEGVEEYKRIIDRAAELGSQYVLFTPANSLLSKLEDNADAWGWENVLWFGLGQKLRRDEWDPRRDEVPGLLRPLIDHAASRGVRLLAYAYPSLPFTHDPEWTAWAAGKTGGYSGADTGLRSFQDWWVETCLAFMRKTGAAGFSFDHWWINYDRASSKYAQWAGARRVLESLRREAFDIVIDGRQQYQNYGPWTWLAGSYPHPVLTDEQPESFQAFPDLHTDRVSADRQRFAAWTYRVERFAPVEIVPGFITHQSERVDEKGVMRRDRFRPRDWDLLGWKYSLLSSVATAPFNHVINFIPARDLEEFAALSDEDKAWFRKWLDWTDENARYLRRLKPIIGPPMLGRVDGTAAVAGDSGYIFLFNPNPDAKAARLNLDNTIGLAVPESGPFVARELYPEEGMVLASEQGFWAYGSEFAMTLPGREAAVLEVFPAPKEVEVPVLFNALGDVRLSSGRVYLTGVRGEPGTERELCVLLPAKSRSSALFVNGVPHPFKREGDLLKATVRFAGRAFGRSQAVGQVPDGFEGGEFRGRVTVPARVFKQLEERKKRWPVNYTDDDLKAAWLAPWRLLLFAALAEPDASLKLRLEIDGREVELKRAYNSVYPHQPERTFLGFYADVSWLKPDTPHEFKLTLPKLGPGRFQGLFFENVEAEYTERLMAPAAGPPPAKK
jgi:hypothetical protein